MWNVCLTKENLASHLHRRMMPLTEVRLDLKVAPRIYSKGAPVLLGVIRIGAKGGSGGSSNLELYTTQPSSSLSPRRTRGNRVVVLLLVLLWPRGKKKKLHIALSHGRRLLLLQYVLVVVKGGSCWLIWFSRSCCRIAALSMTGPGSSRRNSERLKGTKYN